MGVKLTVPQREVVYFLPTKLTMLGLYILNILRKLPSSKFMSKPFNVS
jgi:hypothetical protein